MLIQIHTKALQSFYHQISQTKQPTNTAFITIITMPLAYSISDGILLGVIAYVLTHAISGQFKKISVTMWVLAVLFVLRYIFI